MKRFFKLLPFTSFSFVLIFTFYARYFYAVDTPEIPIVFDYSYESFTEIDAFGSADGYIVYLPEGYEKDSINVIVFTHGWAAHDPIAYGAWIKHLVFQGYAVIYPRYQKSILTLPARFTENAAKGIRDALVSIENKHGLHPNTENLILAGHSFGGVISVNLATEWENFGIPKPAAVMAIQPGHGPMRSGRIEDYSNFPEETQLLFIVSENDRITGDHFAREVFELNHNRVNTMNLLTMLEDSHNGKSISAGHNDPLAMDSELEKGAAFWLIALGKFRNEINQADYHGFWRLLDALAKCNFYGKNCDVAFGGSDAQRYMGEWPDGTPIKPLKVEM